MRIYPRLLSGLFAATCAAVYGCGEASAPKPIVPATVQIAGGDAQTAAVGTALATPISVKVVDVAGVPAPKVTVTFAVASGNGTLSAATALTDSTGVAKTNWTLGTAPGEQTVTATVTGLAAVTFKAIATTGAAAKATLVQGDAQTGVVGTALTKKLQVKVTDQYDNLVNGASVTFEVTSGGGSVSPATTTTGTDGIAQTTWTLGTKAGAQVVTFKATGVPSIPFNAVATPGPASTVVVTPPSANLNVGAQVQFSATAADQYGNALTGRTFTWASNLVTVATVDTAGLARAIAPGPAAISATLDGKSASAPINVIATAAPVIDSIAPARIVKGGTFTVYGHGFSPVAASNRLTLEGAQLTITSATATQLTASVPTSASFACATTHAATLTLNVPNTTGTLDVSFSSANQINLEVGQYAIYDALNANCAELPLQDGQYVLSVFNTSTSPTATSSFILNGSNGLSANVLPSAPQAFSTEFDAESLRNGAHMQVRDAQAQVIRALGRPRTTSPQANAVSAMALPVVGDTLNLYFPDPLGTTTPTVCSTRTTIRARVAYVGPRVIVLEDRTNPTSTSIDVPLMTFAGEVETRMIPTIEANFGNPLAYDGALANTGRVYVVVTHNVTDASAPLLGFSTVTDMYPEGICPNTNSGSYFYAAPPQSAASTQAWSNDLQRVAMHELFHITANAEHMSRIGTAAETGWLSEAMAQAAVELWARVVFAYNRYGNTAYAASVQCEITCLVKPKALLDGFANLNTYMASPESQSGLGAGLAAGNGWMFLRFVLDQWAPDEASVLKALTRETSLTGLANLEAKIGKTYREMLGRYALMLAAERTEAASFSADVIEPSWSLSSIFLGLHGYNAVQYPNDYPLRGWTATFGNFGLSVLGMPGGSHVYLYLSGTPSPNAQFIQLRDYNGGAPAVNLGLGVLRTQ